MTSAVWLVMMSKKTFIPLAWAAFDQLLQLRVGAEVRIDLGEVGDPVTVVSGARRRLPVPCTGLFLKIGASQMAVVPEALDVVELRGQSLEVAAVVEALVGRVEPGRRPAAGEAAGVVGGVAVGEAVGHDEVVLLAGQPGPVAERGERGVGRRGTQRGRSWALTKAEAERGQREPGSQGDDHRRRREAAPYQPSAFKDRAGPARTGRWANGSWGHGESLSWTSSIARRWRAGAKLLPLQNFSNIQQEISRTSRSMPG